MNEWLATPNIGGEGGPAVIVIMKRKEKKRSTESVHGSRISHGSGIGGMNFIHIAEHTHLLLQENN